MLLGRTADQADGRLAFVDALRGWAALAVLFVHCGMWISGDLPHWFHNIIGNGARGVQLFYVVSAFTLFLSVARRKKTESRPIRNFFLRRFFRIAPMFYAAIILYLGRGFLQHHNLGDVTGPQILVTALFLNGWSPAWINSLVPGQWSIAIEMMFYLTVPLLALKIKNLSSAVWLFLATLVASILLNEAMARWSPIADKELWLNFVFLWLPSQAPVFAAGIILFFLWERIESGQFDSRLANPLHAAAVVLMILGIWGGYRFLPTHVVYGLAFMLLSISLAMKPNALWVNRIARNMGTVSFSFYLTHFLVGTISTAVLNRVYRLLHISPPTVVKYFALVFVAAVATYCVAALCYRFIETPGMAIGRRLIKKLEPAAQPTRVPEPAI